MDTLTHALAGALLGRATAPRETSTHTLPVGRRMLIGALAAAAPDLDFITGYMGPLTYLHHHRGITHSIVLLPLWAVLLSLLFALIWRWKPGLRGYLAVTALGIASHIVLDLITGFGTMILAPLSDARFALSATFIIDLWVSGIVVAGLVLGLLWRRSRVPACAAIVVLVAYVGMQVVLQDRATEFGKTYAKASAFPEATVTAMPRPVSPFNWTVIVAEDTRYHYAHVNLVRQEVLPQKKGGFLARLDAAYLPLKDAEWLSVPRYGDAPDDAAFAKEAFEHADFRFYRWFAAYPVRYASTFEKGERCAWFHDLRFATPGREEIPFRYGMCRDGSGAWRAYQRAGEERKPVY